MTVLEDYVALQEEAYVTNTVAEIVLADNAIVNHIRIQRDSNQAFHIANCAVSLALIIVPRNVSVEMPVHLLFIATQKEVASYPRCLLIAGSGSAVAKYR